MSDPQIPPQSLDVERAVLGVMITDGTALSKCIDALKEEDFYVMVHKRIFKTMRTMYALGDAIDVITLCHSLQTAGILELIGSEAYITELTSSIATTTNIDFYIRILQDKRGLREFIDLGNGIANACYEDDARAIDILAKAEAQVFSLSTKSTSLVIASPLSELIPETQKVIGKYLQHEIVGLPTGFLSIDNILCGFQNSDLIIIAGRPSSGKTALAVTIALEISVLQNIPILIFSLEMSKEQIGMRMICSEAEISMHQIRAGTLPKTDYSRMANACFTIQKMPIYVDDSPALTVSQMRSRAKRVWAEHGLGLIVADYLQMMGDDQDSESMNERVELRTRGLKAIAKEFNVPFVVLSQLSREVERRPGHRPELSDLRSSGAIEQDADVVMFVYRPELYERDKPELKGKAEIIVAKQRNGPIGTAEIGFQSQWAKFIELKDLGEPDPWPSSEPKEERKEGYGQKY